MSEVIPIFDGEIHSLDKDYAYISVRYNPENTIAEEECVKKKLIYKYIDYIIKNNPEYVREIIYVNYFMYNENYDLKFIRRPPQMSGFLCQYGTLSLRFKRVKDDELT